MDSSVKYVHVDDASFKPALCFRGTEKAYAVIQGQEKIHTIVIEVRDYDKAQPVLYHGEPYNTKAYADRLLMAAKAASRPISRRARQLLTNMVTGILEEELVSEEPEQTEVESIITISDRSPIERAKAARRPGPVVDATDAYRAAQAAIEEKGVPVGVPPPKAARGRGRPRKGVSEAPPKPPAVPRKTATAPRSRKPAPLEATPPKTVTKAPAKLAAKYGGRGLVVQQLAKELGTDPKSLRVRLRTAGLRAPYTDISKMRKALK